MAMGKNKRGGWAGVVSERMRRRVRDISTGVLRAFDRRFDATLPDWLMTDFRAAIKEELLARDLILLAEEVDGFVVAAPMGWH